MIMMTAQERFAAMLLAMIGDERDEQHDPQDWGLDDEADDWRKHDHVDHVAGAAYWDEIATKQAGGI